jgi:hypothetical protein
MLTMTAQAQDSMRERLRCCLYEKMKAQAKAEGMLVRDWIERCTSWHGRAKSGCAPKPTYRTQAAEG